MKLRIEDLEIFKIDTIQIRPVHHGYFELTVVRGSQANTLTLDNAEINDAMSHIKRLINSPPLGGGVSRYGNVLVEWQK